MFSLWSLHTWHIATPLRLGVGTVFICLQARRERLENTSELWQIRRLSKHRKDLHKLYLTANWSREYRIAFFGLKIVHPVPPLGPKHRYTEQSCLMGKFHVRRRKMGLCERIKLIGQEREKNEREGHITLLRKWVTTTFATALQFHVLNTSLERRTQQFKASQSKQNRDFSHSHEMLTFAFRLFFLKWSSIKTQKLWAFPSNIKIKMFSSCVWSHFRSLT